MKKKIQIETKPGGKLEAAGHAAYMDHLIYGRIRPGTMDKYREAYQAEVLPQIMSQIKARA